MIDSGPLGGSVPNLAGKGEGKLGLELGKKASKSLAEMDGWRWDGPG